MRKSKKYKNSVIKLEGISKVVEKFAQFIPNKDLKHSSFDISNNEEEWSYDSEEEFYAHYGKGFKSARLEKIADGYVLYVWFYENDVELFVMAPTRAEINEIFDIFENRIEETPILESKKLDKAEKYLSCGINKTIRPCLVSKKMILDIESYIVNSIPDIIEVSKEDIIDEFKLLIQDKNKTEQLKSINEYTPEYLPNETKRIEIHLQRFWGEKYLVISIALEKGGDPTYTNIEFKGQKSREVATSISDKIDELIEPNSANTFFHRYFAIDLATIALFTIAIYGLWLLIKANMKSLIFPILLFIFLIIYYWIGKGVKPYIAFDTNKYNKLNKAYNWLGLGLLGFLIFGTILSLVRKKLFGI